MAQVARSVLGSPAQFLQDSKSRQSRLTPHQGPHRLLSCGGNGALLHCGWECKLVQPLWKTLWWLLKKLRMELPYDPAVPLPGMYQKKMKTFEKTHTPQCSQRHYLQWPRYGSNLSVQQQMNEEDVISNGILSSSQFGSVTQSCTILCNPMNRSTPGLPSITNSWSLLKLMSIESVMPSSHLILCRPHLLLPPIPPSIRVFSNESALYMRWPKYWSFSFNISPSNEHPGLISFRMGWLLFFIPL